jgi:uncharacterized membrane protein
VTATEAPQRARRVARWVAPTSLALALGGVAVSTYLTIAHYGNPDLLVCSSSGTIDCEQVTTSAQSTFLGIPVALLGLLWFVGMTVLCLPVAWRSRSRLVHLARLLGAIAGVGFVLWLIYAELMIIGVICLWCTVAHVLAFGLFVVVAITAPQLLFPDDQESYS